MEYNCEDLAKSQYDIEIEILNNNFSIGEEEVLNKAIDIYGHDILKYCHSILCDYYEAEDVTQEVFIKAYKKRSSFKGGTSLSAWLYRIAYTTCMDNIRKRKISRLLYMDIKDEHIKSYDENEFINEDLRKALMMLSPKDRALVFSRVFDKKEYCELETIYNASAQSLRKRYERAKKKLANILRENNFS